MSAPCTRFRAELERALAGQPMDLARLANDAHALGCAECRRELARERALDRLLGAVPVAVPPALARRVLAGLAHERAESSRAAAQVPEGELEELLAALPAPAVPEGLSRRVLQGLAHARTARSTPHATAQATLRPARARLWLAAAGLVAAAAVWAWTLRRPAPEPLVVDEAPAGLESNLEADEELLAYAVERWELLHDEDLDLWLASLDPADEILMEFAQDESWFLDGAPTSEGSSGSGAGRGD